MSIDRVIAAERVVYALRQAIVPGTKPSRQLAGKLLKAQRELDAACLAQAIALEKEYPGDPMVAGYANELRQKIHARKKSTE